MSLLNSRSKEIISNILKTGSLVLFSIFFLLASIVIGHVLDIDYIDPYDRYYLDPDCNTLTFDEWKAREEVRSENLKEYILDDIADAWVFPPWKTESENTQENPSASYHHSEGG